MEFLCYLEVGFKKDGSIEFRTKEDILFPVSEAGGGAPSWTIKYVKGYKQRINIVQVDDGNGKRRSHSPRVKLINSEGETEATRSINFRENNDGTVYATFSIYKNQDSRSGKLNNPKTISKDKLNAAFSFIVDKAEELNDFVNGKRDYESM